MPSPFRMIFLVEDNPVYAEMICNHIESRHPTFSIRRFSTGEEMLPFLSSRPGMIILDYFLDGTDENAATGDIIMQAVREVNPEIHVIMITSSENISVAATAMNAGAYALILKDDTLLTHLDEMIYD
ncbi:MAG: response regulator [Bacteroidia bacterium]|nr:response regulator [Bacteroidia bacterium]